MAILRPQMAFGESTYSFVEEKTGKNIHIASGRLRKWCLDQPENVLEPTWVPVDIKFAQEFLDNNVISHDRLREMLRQSQPTEPIIWCHDGEYSNGAPDVMLVDGHHRYSSAAFRGMPYILSWLLKMEQWKPFEIEGFGDIFTQQSLKDWPIMHRTYWGKK